MALTLDTHAQPILGAPSSSLYDIYSRRKFNFGGCCVVSYIFGIFSSVSWYQVLRRIPTLIRYLSTNEFLHTIPGIYLTKRYPTSMARLLPPFIRTLLIHATKTSKTQNRPQARLSSTSHSNSNPQRRLLYCSSHSHHSLSDLIDPISLENEGGFWCLISSCEHIY